MDDDELARLADLGDSWSQNVQSGDVWAELFSGQYGMHGFENSVQKAGD
jgi:hypothetical protein